MLSKHVSKSAYIILLAIILVTVLLVVISDLTDVGAEVICGVASDSQGTVYIGTEGKILVVDEQSRRTVGSIDARAYGDYRLTVRDDSLVIFSGEKQITIDPTGQITGESEIEGLPEEQQKGVFQSEDGTTFTVKRMFLRNTVTKKTGVKETAVYYTPMGAYLLRLVIFTMVACALIVPFALIVRIIKKRGKSRDDAQEPVEEGKTINGIKFY